MAATPPRAAPLNVRDFTEDEVEVAKILLRLPYFIPLYESQDLIPLITPSWASKRPRSMPSSSCAELSSSSKPKHRRLSGVPVVVSSEGNCRNVSPDTPLLLKSSPESCSVQGSSEPATSDRKGRNNQGHTLPEGHKKDDGVGNADDPAGIITSENNLKRLNNKECPVAGNQSDLPLQIDLNSTQGSQPKLPDAPRTPFRFNLNQLPESTDEQSSTPPASDVDGSSKAAGERRLEICSEEIVKGGVSNPGSSNIETLSSDPNRAPSRPCD